MFIPSRTSRFPLLAALVATLIGTVDVSAQSTTIARPYDIRLEKAQQKPYNFTGRVFNFDDAFTSIGSATLVRRHTALTAGHVVFQAAVGFLTRATFSRGLYQNYTFQKQQVIAVDALSGYVNAATVNGENSFASFDRDLGLLLFTTPPTDEDWGIMTADPRALTNPQAQSIDFGRFVLGYPGIGFDGRTLAYIVPTTPFVQIGTADSGDYENDEYAAVPGMSGGPVYVYENGLQQIAAETVGGIDDSSGTFNASIVHATNAEVQTFLAAAEYNNGLVKKVKIKGPATVTKGSTVTFTAIPKFAVPTVDQTIQPRRPTTTRYKEIQLVSDTPGTPTNPAVTVTKTSNTTFQVKFSSTLRSRSQVTLSANYATGSAVPKSSFVVQVQ